MYKTYGEFLSQLFPGRKMQKITINAGFSCPNRDGTIGRGGCIYCNNASFSPKFASGTLSVTEQIERGKQFFARKYPQMRYLAYFQSYTNTHSGCDRLMSLYREALAVDAVDGLIIGTRPDCIDATLLEDLAQINRHTPIIMEYGAESSHDSTLRTINRCHTWADTVEAVRLTRQAGLHVGLHFIMGLPGEDQSMMLRTVDRINEVKPDTVKFHQLQVISDTPLERMIGSGEIAVDLFSVESYLDLCVQIVDRLDPAIAIERFTSSAPASMLVAPKWGIKNYEFAHMLDKRL